MIYPKLTKLFTFTNRSSTASWTPQIPATDQVKLEGVCSSCRKRRRGAAAVEFAMVAPLFFLLIFGMLEFGRMVMVQQVLTNAAREGARKAVLDGSTTSEVLTTVTSYLSSANITASNDDIKILSETGSTITDLKTVDYGKPIKVMITVPFREVSWLPGGMFTGFLRFFAPSGSTDITDIDLSAQAVMRRETVQQ